MSVLSKIRNQINRKLFIPALSIRQRRIVDDECGTTAIEFGMIALPFFGIIFGIIEVGMAFLVGRLVDDAVSSASRLIRTGQVAEDSLTAEDFADRICQNMPDFLCHPDRIVVGVSSAANFSDIATLDSLYDDEGNLKPQGDYSQTGPSDIVVVNVVYKWPMMVSLLYMDGSANDNELYLSSTMVFRNEPWN